MLTNPKMSTQLGAPNTALRAHEELFSYWAALRQPGSLPRRCDLDPGRIKRAKDILINMTIGLLLIMASYAIITFISKGF